METIGKPREPRPMTRRDLLKAGLAAGAGLGGLAAFGCAPATPPAGKTTAPAAPAAPAAPTAAPKRPAEVNLITGAEIFTLDPNKTNVMETVSVISCITDRLVRMSTTNYGQVEPLLATSWEPLSDTKWRFKLRQGVKFHNGAQFDAETAKWSIERFRKDAVNKMNIEPVDHVEVVDTYTIEIVTSFPTGLIPLMMNAGPEQLEPKWMSGAEYSPEKLVGAGPMKFVEWVKGQRVVLEANPNFWGGRVNYDRMVIRAISEGSTRANAAIAGEGDIVRNILPQDIDRAKARQGVKVATVGSNRVASIRFRDDVKPFDDKLVRQAMNYAVNVPDIVTNVLKGYGKPVSGWIQGPQVRHYQKDVQPYPYDPEKAKSLLAQAGYPRGFTTKIGTPRGKDQGDFEFVQALVGQLKQVGVEAEIALQESADYQAVLAGQKDATPMLYWSSGNIIPDVENALRDLLSKRSFVVRSKELEDIYKKLQRTVDPKEREPIAREGVLHLRDYCPVIFGYQLVQAYAVADRVQWTPRSDEWILADEIKLKA